jgi:hypothetical protein
MSTDPEITGKWQDLRKALTARLRPYVPAVSLDELALAIVVEDIARPGWRPPLAAQPDIIEDARAAGARRALAEGSAS